jgi:mycoredoxin
MAALPGTRSYPRPATRRVPVTVYGRRGCAVSQMVRRYLDRRRIPFNYIDLDRHPQAETQLAWLTGGRVQSPTVVLGGEVLVQPTIDELEWALARSGLT